MKAKTYLIFGVSKGLGKVITLNLPDKNNIVFGISRSMPDYLDSKPNFRWISTDLSNPIEATKTIKKNVGSHKIDFLIYNVGIWESDAFSDNYRFENNVQEEIVNIINTNITSCILSIQSLIENLKLSENPKVILIGSTWGLENHNGKEVTFSASKFALRGIGHALRENFRQNKIGISVLNLGYLATEFDNNESIEEVLKQTNGQLIPMQDVLQALKFILSTSNASCVKEINMPAMNDENV